MKKMLLPGVLICAGLSLLSLPSCSDDDPTPAKKHVRFEVTVRPSCKFGVYYDHQVWTYGDWDYEFYTSNLKNIWFDCATDNDTALITAKIFVDGKFAVMNQGNGYVNVAYSE